MISDEEIALIKAMMKRGMKIKDIQFHFNRPDRPVNTGRFADIRAGRYRSSKDIHEATDEVLDNFLAAPSLVPPGMVSPDPLAPAILKAMFRRASRGFWELIGGETDEIECKETFHLKGGNWLRPMAALANNKGGYILFGVRDKDADGRHLVVGMANDLFNSTDPMIVARRVRSAFDPTPSYATSTIAIGERLVGVMHVAQHPGRPVVAIKNDGDVSEGDIYFRYSGQSAKIKYSDLRTLLDDRDARIRAEMMPMLNKLIELGPSRAMIADLSADELTDGRHSIKIDRSLVDKITFIKQGEFQEKIGAPTLRLIGDVETQEGEITLKKGLVQRADMLADFLDDRSRAEPRDYLRFAFEMADGEWLPIRHFARSAGMTDDDLLAFIDSTAGPTRHKETYRKRVRNPRAAYAKATGKAAAKLSQLQGEDQISPVDVKDAGVIGRAIQGIEDTLPRSAEALRSLLRECVAIASSETRHPANSYIRRAISRLDEVLDAARNR